MATKSVDEVWADFNVDGTVKEPLKQEIRQLLRFIQALAEAAGVGAKSYPTKAAMDADLSQPDGTLGLIYDDPVDANNFPTLWYWNDTGNVWVMGVDRIASVEAAVAALLPSIGIQVDIGGWPLALANAFGVIFAGLKDTGYWYLLKGLLLGDSKLSVVKDHPVYAFALMDQWGVVRFGIRRDGALVLAGSRMRVVNNPVWALAVTNRFGVVFFGIKRDGTCYAKGLEGGGGSLPPGLLEELEAIIAFEEAFQNTDATLAPPGGGDPVDSIPRMQRLFEETVTATVADANAQVAAATAPILSYGPITAYAPATAYDARDLVTDGTPTVTYLVTGAYTSIDLATDLAAGDLVPLIGFTADNFVGSTSVPDYAGLRAYGGPLTRMEVRNGAQAGTFRVRAGDVTSADDGGGIIVGADGRRWGRGALPGLASGAVTYEMFGADPTGVTVADTAMQNCHAFANSLGLEVRQHSGTFLWRTLSCEVRHHMDLRGATFTTDALSGLPPPPFVPPPGADIGAVPQWDDPPSPWMVVGKSRVTLDGAQLATLNSRPQDLKKGSLQILDPDLYPYRGGRLMWRSSTVRMYRNGDTVTTRAAVFWDDQTIIGRNGAIDHQCVVDIPDGTVTLAVITQREDDWLHIYAPKFIFVAERTLTPFRIQRAMVTLEGLVVKYQTTPQDVESRCSIRLEDTFDVNIVNCELEANPGTHSGYGIMMLGAINVKISGCRGQYGWGITGNKWVKQLLIERSVLNRLDAHESGYDWTVRDCMLRNFGFRVQGGGRHLYQNNIFLAAPDVGVSDTAEFLDACIWEGRADYGNDFDGEIEFDGLEIRYNGPFLGLTDGSGPDNLSNATTFDVVRIGYPNIANVQADVSMPRSIKLRNITHNFAGVTNIPDRLRLGGVRMVRADNPANTGKLNLLPEWIEVDGMRAINVPDASNAIMCPVILPDMALNLTGMRKARRYDGTNLDIFISRAVSVLNKSYIPATAATFFQAGNPAAWGGSYTSAAKRCVPRVEIRDCWPTIVETTGEGRVRIGGGTVGRITTGTLAGFVDQATPSAQVDVAASEIQLVPQTAAGALSLGGVSVTTFSASTFKDHLGGSTAAVAGAYRGSGNVNRASPGVFPGVGPDFFIP